MVVNGQSILGRRISRLRARSSSPTCLLASSTAGTPKRNETQSAEVGERGQWHQTNPAGVGIVYKAIGGIVRRSEHTTVPSRSSEVVTTLSISWPAPSNLAV